MSSKQSDFARDGVLSKFPHSLNPRRAKSEEVAQAMYRAYRKGMSIREIANLYQGRYTHQSIWGFFKKRRFALRSQKPREAVIYLGRSFTSNNECYFQASIDKKFVYLHRVVWQDNFGPIPAGMVVHPKNGDRRDISPHNLELLSRADVIHLRKEHHNQFTKSSAV
jgi:hypothetical protein